MTPKAKRTVIAFTGASLALIFLMWTVSPSTSPVVIYIWFGLLGLAIYLGQQVIAAIFSLNWSGFNALILTVSALAVIGLSTLGQLTILDIMSVLLLASLAAIAHRLRSNRE